MPNDIASAIAKGFIERATETGLKGKRRDDAALDYIIGAAKAAEALDQVAACNRLATMAYFVAIKGYKEVERFAELRDEQI